MRLASNPFIAQLGPSGSSERRLNFSQAFNPLGSITAGLIGTVFIFSGVKLTDAQTAAMQAAGTYQAYLHAETLRVVAPYLVLGCRGAVLGTAGGADQVPGSGQRRTFRARMRGPREACAPASAALCLAVLAQFLYVGAQVGTWSYFIAYVESATGVGDKAAGYMLTGTLAAFAVGRFSSAWLMKHFQARTMLGIYAVVNVAAGTGGGNAAELGGRDVPADDQPVHVDHVPDDFCAGTEGYGRQDQDGGFAAGDGDSGRRGTDQGDGNAAERLQAAYLVPVVCFAGVALYAWFGGEHKASELAQS